MSTGNLFNTVIFYVFMRYSIVHALLYLFRHHNWIWNKNSRKTTTYKVLFSKSVLHRLKKLIRVGFSSSNIVEIWVHWMCMAVERKYEYHLYPIRERRHRGSTSIGQVKHFYQYALSSIMFLDRYCNVLNKKSPSNDTIFIPVSLCFQNSKRKGEGWGSPMLCFELQCQLYQS